MRPGTMRPPTTRRGTSPDAKRRNVSAGLSPTRVGYAVGAPHQPQHQALFWPAMAIFAAGWLLFSWPWLAGHVTIPWDAKAHFLPQVQFLAASIARGDWPFWTPNVFAGHPQIADPQSQMFSPPMLLLALLNSAPGNWAIDATVLLCLLAAGWGVLWLFREHDWHPAGGLVAAFGFAFGAAMAWRLQHYGQVLSLAYLPFALVFLKRALERHSLASGLLAGLFGGFIVNGRDQVGLLLVYLLVGYVLTYWVAQRHRIWSTLRDTIPPLAAGAVGGLAVAVIPVMLTLLLAGLSNRPEIDLVGAGRGSLHPALLLTAVVPHLYGAAGGAEHWWGPPSFTWTGTGLFTAQNVGECYIGALALVMLASGLVRGLLWDREIRFFTIALGLSLLYALGWYTPAFRVMYDVLPGVSLYRRPADAVFLIGGLGSIVAGYALHRHLAQSARERRLPLTLSVLASLAAAFALSVVVAWLYGRSAQSLPPMLLALGCFAAAFATIALADWLEPIRPVAALALVGGVCAADLAINNGPNGATGLPPAMVEMLEPASRSETLAVLRRKLALASEPAGRETRRDRVELVGLGFNWPNASLTHGLENTLGYNPVRLGVYSRATGAEDHSGLPDQRKFSPLFPSYDSKLADMLGLRWIASGVPLGDIDKSLPRDKFKLVARTADGYLYENPGAMPRVLFADRAIVGNVEDVLKTGAWPDADFARTVMLDATSPPAAAPTAPRQPGRVRLVSYRNTEVVIESDSPDGGWVVLNDVWHPWWQATIDGAPAPIARANVLFRAVEVPPGTHVVRMTFHPLSGALTQLRGVSQTRR